MATTERTSLVPFDVVTPGSVLGALGAVIVLAFGAFHQLWAFDPLNGVAIAYVVYGAVAGRLASAVRTAVEVEADGPTAGSPTSHPGGNADSQEDD